MSRLTELIAQAKAKDPQLGTDLEREFKAMSSRLPFGLNFERHHPEAVELPQRSIRKGDKVRVLPERGSMETGDHRLWSVTKIVKAGNIADLQLLDAQPPIMQTASLDHLVVVAEFHDIIYPGLVSTGKVMRGGDRPCHIVINGENYHVLKALTYTHRGKVDVIYIDPPYNTGAKDWKYNNDYVEGDDLYRHSKWLAMMERRLLIARELLNPTDSVLIVTIDEKEYLRLGLLLEQIFPEAAKQMVTIVINPNGVARSRELARVEEYAYFLFFGEAGPALLADSMLDTESTSASRSSGVRWEWLMRGGSNSRRQDRPNLFYPIFIDPKKRIVVEVGEPISLDTPRDSVADKPGLTTVWPVRMNGEEANWRARPEYLRQLLRDGHARVGAHDAKNDRWSVLYLGKAQIRRIEEGEINVVGRNEDGSLQLMLTNQDTRRTPKTVWNRPSHKAGEYGSMLVKKFTGNRAFPFPKSLYAVEDTLRVVVAEKPNATILDFFSGSGTTAHAAMRLNRQDGGRRQCICVTNNEVAAEEQAALRERGLRPGDAEWEEHGICDYITKARVQAAITGQTPDGQLINGSYKFIDEFPIAEGFEENAEFFTLTYETPVSVSYNKAFERIAPLLWLRAGSRGRCIDKLPPRGWAVVEAYGLLTEMDRADVFCQAIDKAEGLRLAYVVTDDDRRFQAIARRLPSAVEPIRLYESYLTNFSFVNGD